MIDWRDRATGAPIRVSLCLSALLLAAGLAAADTVTWNVDADGDWADGANWDTGSPPGPTDDVVIDRAAGLYTITVSTGDQAAGSVLCRERLVIEGGSLTVATTIAVDDEFRLSGGKLAGATVTTPLTCAGGTSTADGVTVSAALTVGETANAILRAENGLTLDGTVHLGGESTYGQLSCYGAQTLGGAGEVVLGPSGSNAVLGTGGLLTIGPDLLIHGRNGRVQGYAGLAIEGRISADVGGGTLRIAGTPWSSSGILEAIDGGSLELGGDFTTAGLGDFRGTDGRIAITGVMDNTGNSLALDATTGSLHLAQGGRLVGGTVSPGSGGAEFVLEHYGQLEAVTYDADLAVGATSSATVLIYGGLTLNGVASLGGTSAYGSLNFQGTQTLGGTGEVLLGASGSNSVKSSSGTLTIGPDILIHGRSGQVLGYPGLVNEGRISADVADGTIVLGGTGWSNLGIVEAVGGGSLRLGGTFTTTGLGDFRGAGGRIAITGVMDNTGDSLALDATTGPLYLAQNGRLVGGTVPPGSDGAELVLENYGQLEAVTYDADMAVGTTSSALVTIYGGLTLNGVASLGGSASYGALSFNGTQTLGGTGEVLLGPSGSSSVKSASGTLTIGSEILIHGRNGQVVGLPGLVNEGRISADVAGGTIVVSGTGWTNLGIIEALGGGSLKLGGTFTTAGLGDFRGADGRIAITGVMDNTGDSLALDAGTGSLYVAQGGRLKGGTVLPGSGGAELVPEHYSQLEEVTFEADLWVGGTSNTGLYIYGGLFINGTMHVGGPTSCGQMTFSGGQTLGGTGEVVFGSSTSNLLTCSGGVLTVGPDLWLHGWNGELRPLAGLDIQGRISADVAGGTIELDGSPWSSSGTVEALGGGLLRSQVAGTSTGTVHAGPDGVVTCNGTYTQAAGVAAVDSGGVLASTSPIDVQGGQVRGRGTIQGELVSGGTVGPGSSTGVLTCDGDYEQTAGGRLVIELGGTGAGLHDRLVVTGQAALAGTLAVDLVYDYIPAYGDSFVVLQHGSYVGGFDPVVLPEPPAGLAWRLDQRPEALVLSVGGSSQSALISGIADVPDDEGGRLTVAWWASSQDDPQAPQPVTEYEVQRFDAGWAALDTVPATGAPSYETEVETDDILVLGEPEPWSYYRILARTADPGVFYNSPQDSGYSVDDLPPPAPVLRLTEDEDLRLLHWTNPDVPDFAHTCLYRGEEPGFQEDTLLVCTADTSWVEEHPFFYWYFARAVDVHGNQSADSEEMEHVYPTAAPSPAAAAPRLEPNRPNPFNPRTTIAYHLPREARVRLRIHDLAGRLVRTLVAGEIRAAGDHAVVWDGRDDPGRPVAAGVYLCRLEAGGASRSRRLVLIR